MDFTKDDYTGGKSTLCTGCGHDSITNQIINAYLRSNINPYKVAKVSGIGCSSKTPAYFLKKSHGFNSLHGRMAPVAAGAKIANQSLHVLGISGDGDTASIGLGGFAHLIRRNLPMVYIVENNGVYGLTKGQFSATADQDSTLKNGTLNPFKDIDLCTLALNLGATFVARSFSGDSKQLVPLIQSAIAHRGVAVIDVISPCVAFNNHEGSTKSYDALKKNKVSFQELGFVPQQTEKTADYKEGQVHEVQLHDGSTLILRKLCEDEIDLENPLEATALIEKYKSNGQILTGLFHLNEKSSSLIETLNLSDTPLVKLKEEELRPKEATLNKVMDQFR